MNTLSQVQREAVEYLDGPSLVIAGAGSGKTRVLTFKIAYLLQHGYKPWNVLALTFTNKAAKEMKDRIARIVGEDVAQYLVMGTFHSVFSKILRLEGDRLGYDRNYSIYDDADSKAVIKAATREVLEPLCKTKEQLDNALKEYKPQTIASRIGLAKNNMLSAKLYGENRMLVERDIQSKVPEIHKIYKVYERILRENNAMDFDDLLLNTLELLRKHEDVRQKYAEMYQFILVDEYQDTNTVQQRILELLAKDHHRLCVVGDDAQSIYAFRGANIDNILNFEKFFPEFKLFKLEQNYRSTKNIVAVANDLIAHNVRQIRKNVFSNNTDGDKPMLIKTHSDDAEAQTVAKTIIRQNAVEHVPFNEMVVLYRANAQSRKFEDEFRKQHIPYNIYGGMSFYQRAEIKNILAYFRLTANSRDNESLRRIINYPKRGIGSTTISKIESQSLAYGVTMWEALANPTAYPIDINKGTRTKLDNFVQLISGFKQKLYDTDAATLGKHIILEAGIKQDLEADQSPEGESRKENLYELLNSLQEFTDIQMEEGNQENITLVDFLAQAALQTDQEVESEKDDNTPKVTMMTMHAAKGLEFDSVFIVGLEEEIFPSPRSAESMRGLEEERRLLYVAITRAKKHCYLLYSEFRYLYGQPQSNPPSRFLKDINPSLLNTQYSGSSFAQKNDYEGFGRGTASQTGGFGRTSSSQTGSFGRVSSSQTGGIGRVSSSPSGNFSRVSSSPAGNFSRVSSSPTANTAAERKPKSDRGNLAVGTRIDHIRFGHGTITAIEGSGDNEKAFVDFDSAGKKQLLLKFALPSIKLL